MNIVGSDLIWGYPTLKSKFGQDNRSNNWSRGPIDEDIIFLQHTLHKNIPLERTKSDKLLSSNSPSCCLAYPTSSGVSNIDSWRKGWLQDTNLITNSTYRSGDNLVTLQEIRSIMTPHFGRWFVIFIVYWPFLTKFRRSTVGRQERTNLTFLEFWS